MGALPIELRVLSWSVTLLFVHLLAQGLTAIRDQGLSYNASPRDEPRPLGIVAGRARRALSNYLETYPAFVGLALALAASGRTGGGGRRRRGRRDPLDCGPRRIPSSLPRRRALASDARFRRIRHRSHLDGVASDLSLRQDAYGCFCLQIARRPLKLPPAPR